MKKVCDTCKKDTMDSLYHSSIWGAMCKECMEAHTARHLSGDGPLLAPNPVHNPPHYAQLDPQPWEVVYKWFGIPGVLAHVLKYLARAGRKQGASALEDLEKAGEWLTFLIKKLGEDR